MSLMHVLFAKRKAIKFILLSTVVYCAAVLGYIYYVAVPAADRPEALETKSIVLATWAGAGTTLLAASHLFMITREDEGDDGLRPFVESLVPLALMFVSIWLQGYIFKYHGVSWLLGPWD
ncbi:MAG: hypothetical protein AAGL69_15015 [Pseudomonadota bacterium]